MLMSKISGNWLRWFEQTMKLLKQGFESAEVVRLTIDSVKS